MLGDKGAPGGVAASLGSGGPGGLLVATRQRRHRHRPPATRSATSSPAPPPTKDASWTTVAVAADAVADTISGLGGGDHYDVQVRVVIQWTDSGTYYGDWSDPPVTADTPYIVADGVQVTSTRQSAVDTYGLDNIIEFTVTFSEAVAVTGDPEFEFCLGAATEACTVGNALRTATHDSSKSGGKDVVFTYTVVSADADDDGISALADAVKLDADVGAADSITGTTTDAVTADLSHAALAADSGHKVDGTIEADVVPPMFKLAYVIEDGAKIEIVFNEDLDTSGPAPDPSAFDVRVGSSTELGNPDSVAFHTTEGRHGPSWT